MVWNQYFLFDATFFYTNDFWFLIEYPLKWNIPIILIYTNVPPLPRAICLMHTCLDSKKIEIFFLFLKTHFYFERLQISNRILFQIKYTHYYYLYSCLTYTQYEALNAHLPEFWENWPESRFFDDTLSLRTTSDF